MRLATYCADDMRSALALLWLGLFGTAQAGTFHRLASFDRGERGYVVVQDAGTAIKLRVVFDRKLPGQDTHIQTSIFPAVTRAGEARFFDTVQPIQALPGGRRMAELTIPKARLAETASVRLNEKTAPTHATLQLSVRVGAPGPNVKVGGVAGSTLVDLVPLDRALYEN